MKREKLSRLKATEKGNVYKIRGESFIHRLLLNRGLIAGKDIELCKAQSENYLIKVNSCDRYIVVNKKMADNIIIEISGN